MILWRHTPHIAVGMSQRIYGLLMCSLRLSGDESVFINLVDVLPAP